MKYIAAVILAAAVTLTAADRAVAQTGRELFQQALVKERANGDLRGAIALYERIERDFASDRSLAASALVQLGQCYEKLGSTEAERAYQRVLSEYADQGEFVAQARSRLAALQPATAETTARGPVARRLLSSEDQEMNDFISMVPSPDGRRVAYSRLTDGDLLIRDLDTGDRVLLAPGDSAVLNNDPEWSPDGRRIAYGSLDYQRHTSSVRIIEVATRREIAAFPFTGWVAPLEWSRDGRMLLVRHQGRTAAADASLELVSVASGSTTTVADTVFPFSAASFSPDGRFVAFAAPEGGRSQVFVRPVAGGSRRQLTDQNGGYSPRWSPDGRFIAFTRDDGIWLVPLADGRASGEARLAHAIQEAYLQSWSAAGLYLTTFGEVFASYELPVDPQTGSPEPGGVRPLPDPLQGEGMFAWSPDMQRIAFHAGGGIISIYSVDRQTVTRYDTGHWGGQWGLGWSADGREVVFSADMRLWPGTVLALDPATGRVREPFPQVRGAGTISLSPDGSRVVYRRMAADSSGHELVVAPAGRTDAAVVVVAHDPDAGELGMRPRFSPRGDRVLYGRIRNIGDPNTGPWEGSLWVVSSDGTGARRLGTIPTLQFAAWDPTGRFIAYTGLEGDRAVMRMVEVATGAEHDVPVLPNHRTDMFMLSDWSHDGRLVGFVAREARWEYWLVQGLEDAMR